MLRLTLELIPHGIEESKRNIGTLEIYNDRTGTDEFGNYRFTLTGERANMLVKKNGPISNAVAMNSLWCTGILKGFKRSRGYWSTVKEVLNKIKTDL